MTTDHTFRRYPTATARGVTGDAKFSRQVTTVVPDDDDGAPNDPQESTLRCYWMGPGSPLYYLAGAREMLVPIRHPVADDRYDDLKSARAAFERFADVCDAAVDEDGD